MLYCSFELLNLKESLNCIKYTELTNIGKQSYKIGPESISACAAKHFELWNYYFRSSFDMLSPPFVAKNTQNQTAFHAKIPRSIFEFPCKVMCYLLYNANVVINISYFQLKYAEVKSLIRSWRLSKILLYKTLEGKLSVFFSEQSLYQVLWAITISGSH